MIGSSVKFVSILLMACSAIALVSSTPEMETHALGVLGTVEGKTYFYEKNATNWTTTKQRCEGAGMQMATITSSAQYQLLKTFQNVTENQYYWLGGRDAQTTEQFVWDTTNQTLDASLFPSFFYLVESQTCVAYAPTAGESPRLYSRLCTDLLYVLCEIIHNKNV